MRLFIAIKPGKEMKNALAAFQDGLRRAGVRGNYTKPQNLHLTLAFIGEYGDPGRVLRAIASVPFKPIELSVEKAGRFGDLWWIGLKNKPALNEYVTAIRSKLESAGIPFDKKALVPHITVLRRASADRVPELRIANAVTVASKAVLMRSDRGPDGMIYTEIG